MSVEVDRGYAVLTLDLGSGPQRITNEKYVADNQWYKATVDRSGKTVRFTIAQDHNGRLEETVKEDYLTGKRFNRTYINLSLPRKSNYSN